MATFNATSAVQTLGNGSNNTGNDTFNIPNGSVQAGDVFNGGTGTDTLSLGNNVTINFSVASITAMERLIFGNGGSATFNGNQFSGSLISNSLNVTGAGGAQAIIIDNATNFSAASWTFGSWTGGTDTININGTSGSDTITGSSEEDTISAGGGADTINGGGGADTITGGGGADTINGGGGDDTINIANGHFVAGESIDGGAGIDSIVLTNATSVDFSSGSITSVGRLTGSGANDAVLMSALQWAGFSTAINLGGGASDSLSVVANGDISALGIPATISNIETGNLVGTAGTDTITLTGAQLNAIVIGSGTINLGLGLGDTINLTSTSSDLNSLGGTNASIQGVEAISAATAAAGVTINLGGQSEGFTITGSGQADTLTGGSAVDTINGGGGADTINGGGGGDIINGGGGADIINGGAGADTIAGGSGADTITGGGAADTITGGTGIDILEGGGGVDTYVWSAGDGEDTISASGAANEDIIQINGTFYDYNFVADGDDLLVGVTADDSYDFATVGGSLRIQDFFAGGDSVAYMEADLGPGNNAFYSPDEVNSHIYFSAFDGTDQGNNWEVIIGTDAADVMTDSAGVGTNRFIGLGGDDTMTIVDEIAATFIGGTGADTMTGANLVDTFRGGSGGDTMNGMAEVDLVRYDRPDGSGAFTHGAFVNLSAAAATFDFNGVAAVTVQAGEAIDNWADTDALSEIVTDQLSNIENVRGSAYGDVIVGSAEANVIEGLDGDDTIVGGANDDTLEGGGGVDTYVWSAGDGEDTISASGAANEDIIQINGTFYDYNFVADGDDLLVGVTADDSYDFATVGGSLRIQDFFAGGDSVAYMEADLGPGNNAFYSPDEVNSHIYFSAFDGTDQGNNWEVIIGTDAADVMTDSAGVGTNRFIGLGGDDTMTIVDEIAATFIGGTGADTMTGANLVDTFRGGSGGDTMNGMAEVDLVRYDRPDGSGAFTHGAFVNLSAAAATFDFNGVAAVTVQAGEAIDNWADTDALSEIVTDQLSNIENVRGSAYGDVIVGSAEANVIEGLDGDDTIVGGGGADTFVWNGGDGYDTIVATGDANEDVIQINGTFFDYNWDVDGNDLVIGVAADENRNWEDVGGNLRIAGFHTGGDSIAYIEVDLGEVNQHYYPFDPAGPTRIYLSSVSGTDQGSYFESVMGTSGEDVMTGGGGATDLLSGFEGNDEMSVSEGTRGTFRGGEGDDTMTGAGEIDEAQYGYSNENPDFDHGAFVNLSAGSVTFDFNGTPGVTVLSGQALDNWGNTDTLSNVENVQGSHLDDVLVGSSGENYLNGLAGDDIIVGGSNDDYLVGGANADTFVFDAFNVGDLDTIEDFEIGLDTLQLDGGLAISSIANYDSDGDFNDDSSLVTLDNTSEIILVNVIDVSEGDLFA